MSSNRVGIIGGGPGGLLTAYLLQNRVASPCDITIYEASDRLGGKIATRQFSTLPIAYEAGAAELYDYSAVGSDPLRQLVAELGLTTSPMGGDVVILRNHILDTYRDIRQAFGERTVRELKRFYRRARAAVSPEEYYHSDSKGDADSPLNRNSFRALLDSIPDPHARDYIRVAVHSDLATEPHQTSAMYGLHNYLMNEPEYMSLYTIHGGLERLPQELAKRLTARVLLRHRAARVERTPHGRYRITARSGGTEVSEEFDYVVAALPNNWLPAVEWGGELLGRALHRHHAYFDYPAHYLRVSVLFETPFWRPTITDSYFMIDAFGGSCVYDESSRVAAGSAGVLGWLLAGEAAETMSNLDDAALIDAVLDSLPPVLGEPRRWFREGRIHRWVGSVNGLPGGRRMLAEETRHQPEPTQHPGVFVVGDYLYDSTLNGVMDSAHWVAGKIADTVALKAGDVASKSHPRSKPFCELFPEQAAP